MVEMIANVLGDITNKHVPGKAGKILKNTNVANKPSAGCMVKNSCVAAATNRGVRRPRDAEDEEEQMRGRSRPRTEVKQPKVVDTIKLPNVDAMHYENELYCAEYAEDCFAHMIQTQKRFLMDANNFRVLQREMKQDSMRHILLDWLIEVSQRYHMQDEVVFLTVNIIDRYMSARTVERKRIQLVGVAAMLISAKYEEIFPPTVKEFAHLTDDSYTRDQIMECEVQILNTLNFHVTVSSPLAILERLLRLMGVREGCVQWFLAHLMLDSSLFIFALQTQKPSVLAAAACFLSYRIMHYGMNASERPPWPEHISAFCACEEIEFRTVAKDILNFLCSPTVAEQAKALKIKYSNPKKGSVWKCGKFQEVLKERIQNYKNRSVVLQKRSSKSVEVGLVR